MIKYYCDNCGKELDKIYSCIYIHTEHDEDNLKYHLCSECTKLIKDSMKSEEE